MDNYFQASQAYKQIDLHSQIEGASAHTLIDLLFKGALSRLAIAKGHMQQNNFAQKGEEVGKVIAILAELQSTLNTSDDSEIVDNFRALYTYITDLIVSANVENKPDKIDEAIQLIQHLRESWNLIPNEQRY